jgi:hypothetical protein
MLFKLKNKHSLSLPVPITKLLQNLREAKLDIFSNNNNNNNNFNFFLPFVSVFIYINLLIVLLLWLESIFINVKK